MKKSIKEIIQITKEFCDNCVYDDTDSIFPSFECSLCSKIDTSMSKDYYIPKGQSNE
ncbi:MAG: hypothetical protein GY804_02665 [Alphaproteobacteria bacterium]|nr:hypothetical protein [Alphaproteobacteria bacterium]